ncbi:MAG: response regulator [Caulobacterales bacterium]|jgi:DNA-binding response OmpR family regulator
MTNTIERGQILLAHDEPKLRAGFARALANAGYGVVETGALEEGFDLLYAARPALAIVDANLPDHAALKLAMAASARGAKVIVLDSANEPTDATLTMQVFASARQLDKPVAPRTLTQAVLAVIGAPTPRETPHAA